MYFDPNTGVGQGVEDLNALLLSGNLSAITPLWVTNHGSSYMTTYYMDPITYYNNPYPYGDTEDEQLVFNNVPNSPLPFLTPFSLSAQNPFGAYMFLFANQGDQVTINNAGTNLTITPTSSSGWANTDGLYAGWTIVSPIPNGMQIYTPLWLSFPTATTAVLTAPASGATVAPQSIPFNWTAVPGVINYTLWIGTTPGAKDALYYTTSHTANPAEVTSTTATLLPSTTYYTTLFTMTSAGYTTTTSTFQTSGTAAVTSPANGATNLDAGAPITVSWSPVPGATQYELYLGSSVGANNYYDSGGVTSDSVSVNLTANTTYYARLLTTTAGTVTSTDSVFNTGYSLAHLTYPLNGATNVSPFLPFTWNQPAGATQYLLIVSPTGYRTYDFYLSFDLVSTVTSQYVYALQPETTYYVDLCTNNPGANSGTCVKSSFTTAAAAALPPDRNLFYQEVLSLTAQVRLMTQGTSNIPTPGTPLNNQMLSYGANPALGAKCGNFAATLLNLFTQNGILGRQRGLTADGIAGHVITEYWDPFNQQWQVADPYFGVVYFNLQTQTGQGADQISSLLNSGEISSIEPLFVTSNGALYATSFSPDPMLFYINPNPFGLLSGQANYVPNSPVPFMNPASSSAIGAAGLYVFNFVNQTDSIEVQNDSSTAVISPGNTEGYADVYLAAGWSIVSPIPAGMSMYTYKQVYNYNNPNIYIAPETSATQLLVPAI
jgi:hypothetical protein